jgi:glycosyltransferase involved in cell wall biosynthesis
MIAVNPEGDRYRNYVEIIGEFIEKNNFEARLGLEELIGPTCHLSEDSGVPRCYGVAELYAASSAVISTSVMEGFGFGFLEPWCAGKVAIGRRVPVMNDFILAGMRMSHFYRHLNINDRDFPNVAEPVPSVFRPVTNDFNEEGVRSRLQMVLDLDSGHNLGHFLTENRWATERMLESLVRPDRLIAHNRERAFQIFSLARLAPRLMSAVRGEADPGA